MAQRVENIYRLVTLPWFYNSVQIVLGADAARKRYVREFIRPEPGMRLLDVGCGPATIFPYLPDTDYTGIDLNPKHIEFAAARFGGRGRFIAGDVSQTLPIEDGTAFDIVLVTGLLHHLDDDASRRLLSRCAELTKPGGRIVTCDNVWLQRQSPLASAMNRLDSGLNVRTSEGYLSLIDGLPVAVDQHTIRNMFRIPYDHFCMVMTKA